MRTSRTSIAARADNPEHDGALATAVERGLAFLAAHQLPSGEFACRLTADPNTWDAAERDSCIFATATMAAAIAIFRGDVIESMLARARWFLLREMRPASLWSYWSRRSRKSIDADLDDTSLASHVLASVHGQSVAQPARAAMLANRGPDGWFRTWVRPRNARNDVDAVVNANVVLALGDCPDTARACQGLTELVATDREADALRYYLSPLALYHAMGRAHASGVKGFAPAAPLVVRKLEATFLERGSFGDELDTALGLSALVALGGADRDVCAAAAEAILAGQEFNGGWPARPFYAGPEAPEPHSVWFGSSELTTALSLEALGRTRAASLTARTELGGHAPGIHTGI